MNACVYCGDEIEREGGALLMYCAFCVELKRPA